LNYVHATTLEGAQQTIAQGPAASQIAIKQLGSNGGGYFNANAAHPYENPTPFSNFAQMVCVIMVAASVIIAFGKMIGDQRQSWALLGSMTILLLILFAVCYIDEANGNPIMAALGIDQGMTDINPGGNMEGKEVRFGILNSALWTTATTATSHGSVIAMHDSMMPLTGYVTLFNMMLGEVIYGGIGCGLYGAMVYILITVFIAGLMVGRTPEYLGKKIEAYEIKLAILAQFLYPVCTLVFAMISLMTEAGSASITAPGPHGLSQTLYAYASATANNGSSFGGFIADTPYQNIILGIIMLVGRFGIIIPVLAIAGSLARKKTVPVSGGTFPTHSFTFTILLTIVIVMFDGLTYFPALALGPLAEHLSIVVHSAN
jgi:potassium-transporting ATPase potassium-binding subunit